MSERTELPPAWITCTLRDVVDDTVSGGGPTTGDEFLYVDISSINNQTKRIEDAKRLPVAEAPSRARQRLRSNDVVVSMTRPNLNAVALITPDLEDAIGSTGFCVLRPVIESRYVYYRVQSLAFIEEMTGLVQGALYPAVRPRDVLAHHLPLPPLDEQRRIVRKIEELFTELDAGVAALERVRANLKRYRAAVLKAAVEGALTADWRARRPDVEPAADLLQCILRERRDAWEQAELARYAKSGKTAPKGWQGKYKEPAAPDTTDLPELPEGWCWATVEQLVSADPNAITDGPFGSNLKSEHYTDEGARVIRLQNIGDGTFKDEIAFISQEHYQRLSKHKVFVGDLVIAALGENPPRACIIPEFVGPAIVKADCIRFNVSSHILNTYANYALNADPTHKRAALLIHGVGRPRLNLGEIKSIILPLPPLTEQEQIVAEVERRLSVADDAEARVAAGLKRAARLRQSILKRAFAGQLVPQDPTDEPANALLERIAVERGRTATAGKAARGAGREAAAGDERERQLTLRWTET